MHKIHIKITKHFVFFLHTGYLKKKKKNDIVPNSEWISPVVKKERKNKKESKREKGREQGREKKKSLP